MMRPTRIDARGRSRNGTAVLAYLREGELELKVPSTNAALRYYAGADEVADDAPVTTWASSRWLGSGADMLGLDMAHKVDMADMDKLAHGFDPKTGAKLSRTAGKEPVFKPTLDRDGNPVLGKDGQPKGSWSGGHRVGFDLTFSVAPKGVSLAFAAASPADRLAILEAQRDAVAQAMAYVESVIETGRDAQGQRKIGVAGLVASGFTHMSNRELEPQLHEHVLVYGVAPGADGKWGGWEALQLYEHQQTIGALGRAAFAQNLSKLGYGIEKKTELNARGEPTGEVYFELAGVSDDQVVAFSTRRQQVLDHVQQHGGTKQQAALATRKAKEEPPFEEVDELWQQALEKHRAEDPTMFRDVAELKALPSKLSGVSDDDLLRTLQKREAVWTKHDLIGQLAREHVGQKNVAEIMAEADAFLERMRPQLVAIAPERSPEARNQGDQPGQKFAATRYSARWWVEDVEQAMVDSAKARQHEPQQAVAAATVAAQVEAFQAVRGFAISDEQRAAVDHLTGGQGVSLLTGRAGTGKTTIAAIAVKAWEAEGRTVIGTSQSWDAAQTLGAETGMSEVFSVAKLLHDLADGRTQLDGQTVLVLDEAGMVDSATMRQLQTHADGAGAKLVMMGDSWQLAPVQAGQGFRLLTDAIGDAKLTEIRRQRHSEDVATAAAFYTHADRGRSETTRDEQAGLGAQQLERLRSRNQIAVVDTVPEAVEQLADDYVACPRPDREKLALASTKGDVRQLNEAIRARLQATGQVSTDEHTVALTQEGKRVDVPLAPGDRIRFGKRDGKLGVVNGTIGIVEHVAPVSGGQATLRVRLESDRKADDGRLVEFSTAGYSDLSGAFARTIHKSQGQTVASTFYLANAGTDSHLSLVAFTRSRDTFRMYATAHDLETMGDRLGLDRLRMNALEEGRAEAPKPARPPRPRELEHANRQQVERLHAAIVARREWKQQQRMKHKLSPGLE